MEGVQRPSRSEYVPDYVALFDHSPKMREVRVILEGAASTDATVLIRGESGVGKDLVARAIHAASTRRPGPFIKVNCAALPPELLESELFGHERGAFTGAYRRKPGKFEFASSGTIFLDEIGELPLSVQPKLLQVLQDHEFVRVGGHDTIRADARVIAATNRDLERALAVGHFREDLYYRLNVIEIQVPPLRGRRESIPVLAREFLSRYNLQYHRTAELTDETLGLFCEYSWPGNVRELDNLVRRLVVLGRPELINKEIRDRLRAATGMPPVSELTPAITIGSSLRQIARAAAQEAERQALAEVLTRVHWNRSKAARILRVSYKTLLNRIAVFQLSSDGGHPQP